MLDEQTLALLTAKRDNAITDARALINEARLYSQAFITQNDEDERCFTQEQHDTLVKALALIDSVMDDEWE